MEGNPLDLLDWRRRMFELYREIRGAHDPLDAWELWRGVRDDLFGSHPQSPIPREDRKGFTGLSYFDYDPEARTVAVVRPLKPERRIVEGSTDATYETTRFAAVRFELYGEPHELELSWVDVYGGGLFLSFRDATSGAESYGGGRYLLDTIKGADLGSVADLLILDFNFAYQPSCSYDPKWACPLPPPANRLDVPVRAGERLPPA